MWFEAFIVALLFLLHKTMVADAQRVRHPVSPEMRHFRRVHRGVLQGQPMDVTPVHTVEECAFRAFDVVGGAFTYDRSSRNCSVFPNGGFAVVEGRQPKGVTAYVPK